jgi:hypothetical protein
MTLWRRQYRARSCSVSTDSTSSHRAGLGTCRAAPLQSPWVRRMPSHHADVSECHRQHQSGGSRVLGKSLWDSAAGDLPRPGPEHLGGVPAQPGLARRLGPQPCSLASAPRPAARSRGGPRCSSTWTQDFRVTTYGSWDAWAHRSQAFHRTCSPGGYYAIDVPVGGPPAQPAKRTWRLDFLGLLMVGWHARSDITGSSCCAPQRASAARSPRGAGRRSGPAGGLTVKRGEADRLRQVPAAGRPG